MVKTTIILEDELYKKLVEEALEKYGSTRKLSFLVNQKLKEKETVPVKKAREKRLTIKIGKKVTQKKIDKLIEEGWGEVIKWKKS